MKKFLALALAALVLTAVTACTDKPVEKNGDDDVKANVEGENVENEDNSEDKEANTDANADAEADADVNADAEGDKEEANADAEADADANADADAAAEDEVAG